MPPSIRFRCPGCRVRIKAPGQLLGQTRGCPRCGTHLVVRPDAPEDSGPVLLSDSSAHGVRRRWGAR